MTEMLNFVVTLPSVRRPARRAMTAALVLALLPAGCPALFAGEVPRADSASPAPAASPLSRPSGERPTVTIYEFRSEVIEISSSGGTDMFKTALVNSNRFRVVERARLNEGVIREKQLNAAGLSGGDSARQQLTAAKYVFEGAITEVIAGEKSRDSAFTIAGAQIGHSSNSDAIAIDVRVVDVSTGDIIAVVNVQKLIVTKSNSISGLGSLVSTVLARQGKDTTYIPDVQVQEQRKQSVDGAVRAAIIQAVAELSQKIPN